MAHYHLTIDDETGFAHIVRVDFDRHTRRRSRPAETEKNNSWHRPGRSHTYEKRCGKILTSRMKPNTVYPVADFYHWLAEAKENPKGAGPTLDYLLRDNQVVRSRHGHYMLKTK